jgi:hypothetical protein
VVRLAELIANNLALKLTQLSAGSDLAGENYSELDARRSVRKARWIDQHVALRCSVGQSSRVKSG